MKADIIKHNNRIQLTVISVIFFAIAKKPPLMVAAEAGVRIEPNPEQGIQFNN